MIRLVLALLLALGLASSAQAAPARDWRAVVTRTAQGAYVTGNPAARVRLVEYLSYTCPHCAAFSAESGPVLRDRMVRDGSVSVELRHAVREPLDLAATLLVRCLPPARFAAASALLFARQSEWYGKGAAWSEMNTATVSLYPETAQIKAYAGGAGLPALLGLTDAQVDRCLADSADRARVAAMTQAAWARIDGTPAFELNGTMLLGLHWAELGPKLRAAGARG